MSDEENIIHISGKEATKMQMLDQWLKELIYPGKITNFIQEIAGSGDGISEVRSVCFYTEELK